VPTNTTQRGRLPQCRVSAPVRFHPLQSLLLHSNCCWTNRRRFRRKRRCFAVQAGTSTPTAISRESQVWIWIRPPVQILPPATFESPQVFPEGLNDIFQLDCCCSFCTCFCRKLVSQVHISCPGVTRPACMPVIGSSVIQLFKHFGMIRDLIWIVLL
jgi:hypothetical protein